MRLKGFTLLEVILALMLSLITVVMAYKVLGWLKNEWYKYKSFNDNVALLMTFKTTIENDISKSAIVKLSSGNIISILFEDDVMVNYLIQEHVIRLSAAHRDTFNVHIDISHIEYIESLRGKQVIKRIVLHLSNPIEIPNMVFEKNYTSSDLMNNRDKIIYTYGPERN